MELNHNLTSLVFIDSCALLCAFKGEDEMSNKVMEYLDDPNNQFIISDFLKLELLPKPTYFGNEEEVCFLNAFFDKSGNKYISTSEELFKAAFKLACDNSIDAVDALHVAATIEGEGDMLITAEKATKPMFRVQELDIISVR